MPESDRKIHFGLSVGHRILWAPSDALTDMRPSFPLLEARGFCHGRIAEALRAHPVRGKDRSPPFGYTLVFTN
jgi:hypothetical protein